MARKTPNPQEAKPEEGQPEGVKPTAEPKPEPLPGLGGAIPKPSAFSLDGFRSKRSASIGGVATLPASLPIMRVSEAKDFIRLHPNEAAYWSDELCFVHVPTKGVRGGSLLHLILEDLACAYLPEGKIIRHRLALASKPDDVFFLASPLNQPRQFLECIHFGGLRDREDALGAADEPEECRAGALQNRLLA